MLLSKLFPSLADEVKQGLLEINERSLADSIGQLEICGRCQCAQRNCGTFYTRPREEWIGQPLRQVVPYVHRMIAIDVHEDRIVCLEFSRPR
jgi:hypothetical protein